MADENTTEAGGCLCGAIRYTFDREGVVGQAHCHCPDCQRSTGSAFATFCFVPDAHFEAEQGEPRAYTVQGTSGGDVTRFFCPDCGSQLYSQVGVMPGVRFVKAGSLDDSSWMQPQAVFWCDTMPRWVQQPEGLQRHARNPG